MRESIKSFIMVYFFTGLTMSLILAILATRETIREDICRPPYHNIRYITTPWVQLTCWLSEVQ